jgi:hypothetical protein
MNQDAMFSNWIFILYCLMTENQPRIKRTVLFVNLLLSLVETLVAAKPTLHRLVIHPFLDLRTDFECGIPRPQDVGWTPSLLTVLT